MADRYAEIEDLYAVGVPRGSLVSPARIVSSVDVSGNRITCEAHGLADDTVVQVVADPGATLPTGLSSSTDYYARVVSESVVELAATEGGAAINITDDGDGLFRLFVPLVATLLQELEVQSRWLDSLLTGHTVPLIAPFPAWATAVVAKRAAASIIRRLGLGGLQSVLDEAREATADILRMAKSGVALRDAAATSEVSYPRGRTASSSSEGRWSCSSEESVP